MSNAIVSFLKRKIPQRVKWEEVREEILKGCEEMTSAKVRFKVSPYYFTVTNGPKTWYWIKETGEFDGTSWDVA